jgi:hypothetical protein
MTKAVLDATSWGIVTCLESSLSDTQATATRAKCHWAREPMRKVLYRSSPAQSSDTWGGLRRERDITITAIFGRETAGSTRAAAHRSLPNQLSFALSKLLKTLASARTTPWGRFTQSCALNARDVYFNGPSLVGRAPRVITYN